MSNYSSYIAGDNAPAYQLETARAGTVSPGISHYFKNFKVKRYTIKDGGPAEADPEFEALMKGLDAESKSYTRQLKSIYDGYGKYAREYGENAQPIADALAGDIEDLTKYSEEYRNELAANKDTFINGIVLDPNANRTRSEYLGAVTDQFKTAREGLRRDQVSQGINPYQNKGATRELAQQEAVTKGLATGRAYTDWWAGYNRDKQAQQSAVEQYLDLNRSGVNQIGDITRARGLQERIFSNINDTQSRALTNRAGGYTNLYNLNEGRRTEALSLKQNKENINRENQIARTKIQEGLINSGKGEYQLRG